MGFVHTHTKKNDEHKWLDWMIPCYISCYHSTWRFHSDFCGFIFLRSKSNASNSFTIIYFAIVMIHLNVHSAFEFTYAKFFRWNNKLWKYQLKSKINKKFHQNYLVLREFFVNTRNTSVCLWHIDWRFIHWIFWYRINCWIRYVDTVLLSDKCNSHCLSLTIQQVAF